MTTKPKAKKFRIRRNAQTGAAEGAAPQQPAQPAAQPGPASAAQPTARAQQPRQPQPQQTQQPQHAQPSREYLANVRKAAEQQPAAQQRPVQASMSASGQAQMAALQPDITPDGLMQGTVPNAAEQTVDQEIDAIRQEGLTGRQLRMARRVAQKNGLAPTSDFDAVRLLRAEGIDPFKRSTMLELVVPQDEAGAQSAAPAPAPAQPKTQLPQTVPQPKPQLPSTELSPAERRTNEIGAIQRDIAKRRRRKLVLLSTRLSFFILLPTLLVGWYFHFIASPLYATKSEFLVLQADSTAGGGIGGLLSGTQFATNQDAIAVQNFLTSRPAMLRLNEDLGFKDHFSQENIDPIKRLSPDATDEEAYKLYKRNVKIGYDPTEGVLHMEVIAADPNVSAAFAEHLISYAEEQVDELSRRKREDQMREARASLDTAKAERREAQRQLVELQEGTLLDPQGEIASIRALINNVEVQLQDKQLQLQSQLNNARPNRSKVTALETEVRLLSAELIKQNSRLNDATNGDTSLAAKAAQIQMAQADLATADLFLQSALQNEKQTALEANRQVRYLTTAVNPIAPDEATYPRAFENTLLAFLVLSGVYLMISLTASILREQVSS